MHHFWEVHGLENKHTLEIPLIRQTLTTQTFSVVQAKKAAREGNLQKAKKNAHCSTLWIISSVVVAALPIGIAVVIVVPYFIIIAVFLGY